MSRAVRSSTAGHDRERVAHHVSTATSTNEAPSNYVYLSVLDGFGTWRGPDSAQGLRLLLARCGGPGTQVIGCTLVQTERKDFVIVDLR